MAYHSNKSFWHAATTHAVFSLMTCLHGPTLLGSKHVIRTWLEINLQAKQSQNKAGGKQQSEWSPLWNIFIPKRCLYGLKKALDLVNIYCQEKFYFKTTSGFKTLPSMIYFGQKIVYQKQHKYAMKIGVTHIRGAPFIVFIGEKGCFISLLDAAFNF